MAVDERSRHQLFKRLEETLGEEHATVLMEHLPPAGWADVATTRDLEWLEAKLRAELHAQLNAQTRTMVQWLIFATTAATFAVGGLAFAAARLV